MVIEKPQSFMEFLKSQHKSISKQKLDAIELEVHMDFDLWVKGMNQKDLFDWVEVYRECEAFRFWGQLERVAGCFVDGL